MKNILTRKLNKRYCISIKGDIYHSKVNNRKHFLGKYLFQIGCCGADGPHDYLVLQQPLPSQCRDSVTGNPYYHGCVHELTWFFEEKCAWIAALVMTICFIHVSNMLRLKRFKKSEI